MSRSHPGFVAALCVTIAIVLLPLEARAGRDPGSREEDWFSTAQRRVAAQEYELSWQAQIDLADVEASWQAPNRKQGFRTYFTDEGIRLVSRTEADPSWRWGLELTGYGRDHRLWPVAGTVPQPEANRINYARGAVEEWYVNEPRGLKQGFTLWGPPEDSDPAGALRSTPGERADAGRSPRTAYLELTLSGTLRPSIPGGGQAIDFHAQLGGNVLRYSGLQVTDATGRELDSWMELSAGSAPHRIRLFFDDDGALYPLTVDPLVSSPSWSADGDQQGARFGQSVASAGDVNGDEIDDLIVGAPGYDNGQVDEGRAYLYLGSSNGLSTEPAWTAESDQRGARFGHSVAGAGYVNGDGYADVVIGAHLYDGEEIDEGRAYVFHGTGSASGLEATAAWTAEGGQAGAGFGYSVARAGRVNDDDYDDIVVGAPLHDVAGDEEDLIDAGRAYVFHGSASGLEPVASWIAEGERAYDRFGYSAGSAGDVQAVDGIDGYDDLAVGAPGYGPEEEGGDDTDVGKAYVYYGSSGGLAETAGWDFTNEQAFAYFGQSLGTAGDVNCDGYDDLIAGAYRYANGEAGEGRAYVFHGSDNGLSETPDWTAESDQTWAYLGAAVATAGDLNGDGCSEVIVGAPGYNTGRTDAGRVYIYQGRAPDEDNPDGGLTTFPVRFVDGTQSYSGFGESVSTAGDVNSDGVADVVAAAPSYFGEEGSESGRVVVYHGSEPDNEAHSCATLGDAPPIEVEEDVFEPVEIDEDIFAFNGTETEQITVTLEATSGQGRATLYLMDDMGDAVELFEADRTDLPSEITVTLPASGEYLVAVVEQPDLVILPGLPFSGDYCVTLISDLGAAGSFEPTDSVESGEEASTEPAAVDDPADRVTSPVRLPRIGAKKRPLPL